MCLCAWEVGFVYHVHAGACRSQKRASNPLELKLKVVVSHCVNTENHTHDTAWGVNTQDGRAEIKGINPCCEQAATDLPFPEPPAI